MLTRLVRRPGLALLLMVAVVASVFPARPADAQYSADTGIISITVRGNVDGKPLADARVFLLGPATASALTNRSGIVKYTDVPSGVYRIRVNKPGFSGEFSREFELLGNKEVDVIFNLQEAVARRPGATASSSSGDANNLKVIGTVKTVVSINTRDVDVNGALARVSDGLADALNKIAGVDVTTPSNDPDAAQTISLRNMDESQTAVTVDGLPLGAPGSAVNLRSFGTDLFTGAGVSFSPQAGSLGGSVNFRTLQPTQTWQSRLSVADGSFDKYNYQIGETGSIGKLGIAVLHSDRGGNNPLTFDDYEDQSGLTYPHGGESTSEGDYVKLRYGLGDATTLTFTALENNNGIASLCTQVTASLPCGIGPGNTTDQKAQLVYFSASTLVGETDVTATGFINDQVNNLNDANRYIDGVNYPSVSATETLARGYVISSTLTRDKHTFSLTAQSFGSLTTFDPKIDDSPTFNVGQYVFATTTGSQSQTYTASDSYKASDRLSLGPNFSYATTTGAGSSVLANISASWRPNIYDTYTALVGVGSSQPGAGIIHTYSDPATARFTCVADTATVSGPGDEPGRQSAANYQAGWTHTWRTGGFDFSLFQQNQTGQLVQSQVDAEGLNLPPGYFMQVVQFGMLPTNCGPAFVLPIQNLYVNESIGDTTRVYKGYSISGQVGFGPHIVIMPSYSVSSAVITAADEALLGPNSTTILNTQLPGRPLHKGNVTLDAQQPQSGLEFLANVAYTGPGNSQHIGAYGNVSAAISHNLGIGRLSLLETNVFNTETALFSTLLYSTPIPLANGGHLLTVGNPNPPRAFTLTYSFNTGARAGAGFARGNQRLGREIAAAASPGPSPGPGGGGNRLAGRFTFVAPPAGTDPLALDTADATRCPADSQPKAQTVIDEIKAAAAAYTATGKVPAAAANSAFTIVPHGDPHGKWYFELRPSFGRGPGGGGQGGRRNGAGNGAARGEGGPGGGFGGPGGPGGEPGGPPPGGFGGPGGPGPGGPGPAGEGAPLPAGNGPIVVAPAPQSSASPGALTSPRPRPSLSPEQRDRFDTIRAFTGCSYVSVVRTPDAKAKGITQTTGFGYLPGLGFFIVLPPDLGTGGGSVKQ